MSVSQASIDLDASVRPQRVVVRINEPYLRVAAFALLESGGVEPCELDDGTLPLVTDDHRQHSRRTILIVADNVGAAQAAVVALRQRRLGGVVSRREPAHLLMAVACMAQSMVSVPTSVLDKAEIAPLLDARELRILTMVAAGMSNVRIAERLSLSEPTIKREISDLFRKFDCSTRIELAMKAAEVGYS